MEIYKIENLTFTYPSRTHKALDNISLSVNNGEFITLCGKSGCGKTTLLRALKPILTPHGSLSGSIFFNGKSLGESSQKEQASKIGFVLQNPDNQLVTDKVWHELAFGLESLGLSTPEIRTRVSEMASFFGIQTWFYKKVTELSGGQKQLLNLASVMVMQPEVLILDEPTAQLDPIAALEFLNTLGKINRELGTTVILSEHRLEDALPVSDRVIVMDDGKIIADSDPKKVGELLKNHAMFTALPAPIQIYNAVEDSFDSPLTVCEGRRWLERYSEEKPINPDVIPLPVLPAPSEAVIELKDVYFRYEKNSPDIIKGLNVQIHKGELFAIVGGNGTGKTTALSLICGLNTPYRGRLLINGKKSSGVHNRVSMLPQNPQSIFVQKTVYLDLLDMLSDKKMSKSEKDSRIREIAVLCRIDNLLDFHPYDLSGGEQQRAALAKVLLTSPEILLLDEPTKGLDAHFKQAFANIIDDLKKDGVTIVMVSHDIEFCAAYADRCAMFFDGNISSVEASRKFFSGNSFYTTAANRMARTLLPNAVLNSDVILACGAKPPAVSIENTPKKEKLSSFKENSEKENGGEKKPKKSRRKKLSKSTLTALFLISIAVPFTIYAGARYLGNRKYYFISLLIILETLIPFCMIFERKKPQARDLVLISSLCAIAVAGRTAFFMLPQFKPVAAIVIISGVCFGGETGFLVGAVTGFVSNFFFGQGPWTPWQMFAFGLIGFIAGLLFETGLLRKTKLSLCIFGFLAALIVYGGIMNPASVIMYQSAPTKAMLASAYAMGLPYDIIHAVSTAVFLWLIAEPMLDKLERIKVKYGLLSDAPLPHDYFH